MNTERPDNDDTARGPEHRGAPEATRSEGTRPEETRAEEPGGEKAERGGAARESSAPESSVPEPSAPESAAPESASAPAPDSRPKAAAASATEPVREEPAALAAGAPEPADGPSGDESAPSPDVSSAGSRRRSHVLVASVAAAVLLVGGGGACLAARTTGGSGGGSDAGAPSGDGTPPALVLDDYAGGASGGPANGIAPGEPNPYGVTYRADGALPEGPDSAPAYWARGEVTKDEVVRLAAVLGVEGTPVAEGRDWRVGSGKDGSGPVLRVNGQAPGPWTFTRYLPRTDDCESTTVCAKAPTAPGGDPVSEAAAKKAAAPVLKALGQDDAKIDASQVMGGRRIVNAEPEIGGLPTYGWTTGLSVNARGEVVGGSGQVKSPVKGDTYPVLSARETLDRMNAAPGTDRRTGIGGCASAVPTQERPASPCGGSTEVPGKESLTVEDAVFGLAPHASGGRQVLVPSWLFEVRGAAAAYTVTYPAVEPEFLGSPPASTPSGAPTSGGRTSDVGVDGYTAEGDELTVAFTGGVCSEYAATAVEGEDEVKVTVTETSRPGRICIMIAKVHHLTVRLDEPLGGRTVVGSDGRGIPLEKAGARLPR
ncbi:hypothetical protein ACH4F6_28970 [Streptomyces sp. NPDC017936]|uniref:hypothetical protein n=1 Tax=Streptomyces sp. NPDC017936 TaxID=3365016 RepID=UPI0037A04DB6